MVNSVLIRACPPPYQSGVGLSGTLSIPLSLHFVQTTPPIPHAKNKPTDEKGEKEQFRRVDYFFVFPYLNPKHSLTFALTMLKYFISIQAFQHFNI